LKECGLRLALHSSEPPRATEKYQGQEKRNAYSRFGQSIEKLKIWVPVGGSYSTFLPAQLNCPSLFVNCRHGGDRYGNFTIHLARGYRFDRKL
jgi:hypothetical protein